MMVRLSFRLNTLVGFEFIFARPVKYFFATVHIALGRPVVASHEQKPKLHAAVIKQPSIQKPELDKSSISQIPWHI